MILLQKILVGKILANGSRFAMQIRQYFPLLHNCAILAVYRYLLFLLFIMLAKHRHYNYVATKHM